MLLLPAAYNYAVGAVDKAAEEQAAGQSETMNISIGVLKGPSGIGIIKLVAELKTLPQNVSLDYMIVADPLEMLTRLTSGELQAGLLPLNVAAKLYTKGSGYPLAAIPGLGALYILSRDSSINDWQDLAGKTVYAHGKGATPDYLFHYFLNVKGIDSESVFLNFSIPAPQLAPMGRGRKSGYSVTAPAFCFPCNDEIPRHDHTAGSAENLDGSSGSIHALSHYRFCCITQTCG